MRRGEERTYQRGRKMEAGVVAIEKESLGGEDKKRVERVEKVMEKEGGEGGATEVRDSG